MSSRSTSATTTATATLMVVVIVMVAFVVESRFAVPLLAILSLLLVATTATLLRRSGDTRRESTTVIPVEGHSSDDGDKTPKPSHRGETHPVSGLPVREALLARMNADSGGLLGAIAFADFDRLTAFDPALADKIFAIATARLRAMLPHERFIAQVDRGQVGLWFGRAIGSAAARAEGNRAGIAWAGDSRAYRLRGGKLELLTRDHSVVQELIDAGLLTADQAERHPRAYVVTRALGVDDDLECQTLQIRLAPGDSLLLCSDGLSRSFAAEDEWTNDPLATADRMLDYALDRDGSDNMSLILIAAQALDRHRL